MQHWASAMYEQTGNTITNETEAPALLMATVCQRLNTMFDTTENDYNCSFGIHPPMTNAKVG